MRSPISGTRTSPGSDSSAQTRRAADCQSTKAIARRVLVTAEVNDPSASRLEGSGEVLDQGERSLTRGVAARCRVESLSVAVKKHVIRAAQTLHHKMICVLEPEVRAVQIPEQTDGAATKLEDEPGAARMVRGGIL